MVLRLMSDSDENPMDVRELSERIAELETGESPPPRNIRQSAYVSLHQTHLPKLQKFGIVVYHDSTKDAELTDRFANVEAFMETVPKHGLSWSEQYLLLAILGGLLVVCSELGVPVLSGLGSLTLAIVTFLLIGALGVYQISVEKQSILHRHWHD